MFRKSSIKFNILQSFLAKIMQKSILFRMPDKKFFFYTYVSMISFINIA